MKKETFYTKLIQISTLIKRETYFSSDENDGDDMSNIMSFRTRENGDVGNEEPSEIDIAEARRVIKLISPMLKELNLKCQIELVDEWVDFCIYAEEVQETYYVFMKHTNSIWSRFNAGAGFSETFTTLEELNKSYGSWVKQDVSNFDFGEVDEKGDGMVKVIKVLDVDDERNTWGYNFSLGIGFKKKTPTLEEHLKTI